MSSAYVVGTFDTKGEELRYVAKLVAAAGAPVVTVDVGTCSQETGVSVSAEEVAACYPGADDGVHSTDRGTAISAMSEALVRFVLDRRDDIGGVIGLGGSGGTALITPAMRVLPVGIPKVMVSTLASSDVACYVDGADITMWYPVTDIAGLNRISRLILGNAAHALAGMVTHQIPAPATATQPAVGLTMFGVTTPCVTGVADRLRGDGYDPLIFHATGIGGRSMERLAGDGALAAVVDLTTTEIADLLVGGVLPAGADRLEVIARTGTPYVGSCGALDMVNFWARHTVPERFADRLLHVHNDQVTLMRTTPDENIAIGEWIAAKLNACEGPVCFLIPEGGVSMLDASGLPFHDPEADAALFTTLEKHVRQTEHRRLVRLPYHINDPEFVDAVARFFAEVVTMERTDPV